jgi:ATP-dependent DNA helicase RecQ
MKEENILADTKDLTAYIRKTENKNRSLNIVESFIKTEQFLLPLFDEQEKTFQLKKLNEDAESHGCTDVSTNKIKTIINFWKIKNWLKSQYMDYSKNYFSALLIQPPYLLKDKLEKRQELARFLVEYLFDKCNQQPSVDKNEKDEVLVEFSVHELKTAYETSASLFKIDVSLEDIEDTLFYLQRIEAIKIEGGFLVMYNRMTIERLEKGPRKQYTKDDYEKLNQFYDNKVQQIHIVGEYARKMINDYRDALQFVDDYFKLNYSSFLTKYFPGSKANDLKLRMTPAKFKQLFGDLSPAQLKIINDNESKYIVVAAGPGSGKTRVLVHKLASLLLMEDVKHEQLLMLTFSRAAVTEFKKRLYQLIGNAAAFVDIKTFHAYCFDLLGRVGNLEKSDAIIQKTIEKIKNGDVEMSRITKTVLVIDEAQDMDEDEFGLIKALMEQNEEMRVIAVGDDDQNIFEFRGADSKYLAQILQLNNTVKYELVENYRSKHNLVEFSNQFVERIQNRLKVNPIIARQNDNGLIRIVYHKGNNLITPIVDEILQTDLTGTACVLTKTNEEALQITGLLLKNGTKAKLIQSNEGFSLYNLAEVRFFIKQLDFKEDVFVIKEDVWENAKREFRNAYQKSSKYEIITKLIQNFEITNPKIMYKSDFEVYIRESKIEDFYGDAGETILISTIHKAKGKEFDSVFLLLENINILTDSDARLLYVAMTRAKQNLVIHLNSNHFNNMHPVENLVRSTDKNEYELPGEILMQLGHKDVWLDFFKYKQFHISKLMSGNKLLLNGEECQNIFHQPVLKFSKSFMLQIENLHTAGYEIKDIRVNYIIFWKKDNDDQEIKIILPELVFQRKFH